MSTLEIKKKSITDNVLTLSSFCSKRGIQLCVVTKCCCSEEEIFYLLYDTGIKEIADSNQENFCRLPDNLACNFSKSVIKARLTDIKKISSLSPNARPWRVFVSDEMLLDALAEIPADVCPDIMLIIEVGDLKEGLYPQEVPSICKKYNTAQITGQTFDFTVMDITESSEKYKTGQYMGFSPSYGAVSFAMLNQYVKKVYK